MCNQFQRLSIADRQIKWLQVSVCKTICGVSYVAYRPKCLHKNQIPFQIGRNPNKSTLPKKKPVAPKKQPTRKQKKIQMNKRLQRFRREEASRRVDEMTDDELEEAMFSGADLRELGLD